MKKISDCQKALILLKENLLYNIQPIKTTTSTNERKGKGINKMTTFEQALKNLDHLYVFMMLYIDNIESGIKFTFDEYLIARKKYTGGKYYYLTHTDGTKQKCLLDYFPLPRYKDMRALVEFGRGEELYWKEVPVKYLEKT